MKYHATSKHLTFMVTHEYENHEKKAGSDTIIDVIDRIGSLENRLDTLSQNI